MSAATGIGEFLGSPVWQGVGALVTIATAAGAVYLRSGSRRALPWPWPHRKTIKAFDLTEPGAAERFYNELFHTIRLAREQAYRAGAGFGAKRADYPQRLLQVEEEALTRGVEITRVQTSPRAFHQWANGLADILDRHPTQLRVFANFRHATPDFSLIDPYGPRPIVLMLFDWPEPAVSSIRTRAAAAFVFYNYRSIARGLAEDFVSLTQTLPPMAPDDVRGLAKPHFYFGYGPHMLTRHMQHYVPGAVRLGPARLPGWRLVLSTTPLPSIVSARIERTGDPQDFVDGVVYELSEWDKQQLLDSEPGTHRVVQVGVERANDHLSAFAIVHQSPTEQADPSAQPADLLLMIEGAEENRYGRLVERLQQLRAEVARDLSFHPPT